MGWEFSFFSGTETGPRLVPSAKMNPMKKIMIPALALLMACNNSGGGNDTDRDRTEMNDTQATPTNGPVNNVPLPADTGNRDTAKLDSSRIH
jgi:hypothetical protein